MNKTFLSIIIIFLLGLVVYYNSLGGKFIWDDEQLVKKNLRIKSWSGLSDIFTEDLGEGSQEEYNFYRPLQILSYRIDYALWRLLPRGYHLTNILLHVLAALAVYFLVNALCNDKLLSLLTASLFTVHPVHTEAVSYISGRADPLALIFMLACFNFYIRYVRSGKTSAYLLVCLSYVLALLSRESSLTLPLLLLLYHYAYKKKITVRCLLPILVIPLAYVVFRTTVLSSTMPDLTKHPLFLERIPSFFAAVAGYVRLLILPFGLHMEYGAGLFSLYDPQAVIGIVLVTAAAAWLIKAKRSDPLTFFSSAWFCVSLLPVSGIYPLNAYMAEHWLYLPSVGFFLLLSRGAIVMFRSKDLKTPAAAFISVLLIFYSYLTVRQNDYWREPISFFKTTLKYTADSFKIHNSLGCTYSAIGMHEEAISSYQKTLQLNPDCGIAHYNLGCAYEAMGKLEEAIASYEKAIETNPEYAKAYNNLGNIYSHTGENERATALYKKAIEVDPRCKDAYYNLGNEYRRAGDNKKAIESYKKALERDPYDAASHNNLAVAYFDEMEYDLAIEHCDMAIKLGLRPHPGFLKELEPHR